MHRAGYHYILAGLVSHVTFTLYQAGPRTPQIVWRGIKRWWRCPFVCLSVCRQHLRLTCIRQRDQPWCNKNFLLGAVLVILRKGDTFVSTLQSLVNIQYSTPVHCVFKAVHVCCSPRMNWSCRVFVTAESKWPASTSLDATELQRFYVRSHHPTRVDSANLSR